MGKGTKVATVWGIPIKVHITLWILAPFMAIRATKLIGLNSLFWGLVAVVGLFASVAIHELGHSLIALQKGCRVREILLLPIGGIAQLNQMPRRPIDEVQVAIAGPLTSLLLFVIAGGLAVAAHMLRLEQLAGVFGAISGINLMLALFNLLPSFPMDGGRVFRAFMTPRVGRVEATRLAAKIGRIMAIAFGVWGLFSGHLMLIAIAVFIYMAAGAEYRMVRMQEGAAPGAFGFWAPRQEQQQDYGIHVGPPPYGDKPFATRVKDGVKRTGSIFEDLYQDWK